MSEFNFSHTPRGGRPKKTLAEKGPFSLSISSSLAAVGATALRLQAHGGQGQAPGPSPSTQHWVCNCHSLPPCGCKFGFYLGS